MDIDLEKELVELQKQRDMLVQNINALENQKQQALQELLRTDGSITFLEKFLKSEKEVKSEQQT